MGARFVDEETIRSWISEGGVSPSSSYSVYTALLSQSGISAPTVSELENTLTNTPVPAYVSAGHFQLASIDFANQLKVFVTIQPPISEDILIRIDRETNAINITTYSIGAADFANDALNQTSIEIRVYP